MSVRVCNVNGCPRLTDSGGKCERHRKEAKRASAKRRRHTPEQQMYAGVGERGREWRRVRAEFVRTHPVCEWPQGCIELTEHVHHVDGDPLGPDGLNPSALQGLCRAHHSALTARSEPGGWNARVA